MVFVYTVATGPPTMRSLYTRPLQAVWSRSKNVVARICFVKHNKNWT